MKFIRGNATYTPMPYSYNTTESDIPPQRHQGVVGGASVEIQVVPAALLVLPLLLLWPPYW